MLKRLWKDESGVTALETAIILIAFVVVAAVFAFTTLTTGSFLTERSKEAAYSGLAEVRGSMEMRGSMVASNPVSTSVSSVVFTLANVAGGEPIDLNDTAGQQALQITYRDANQNVDLNTGAKWTVTFLGKNNGDKILEQGELAQITADLTGLSPALGPNTSFSIEVKPPRGAVLLLQRTTPARLDPIVDLK